ncbi:extracellular solute-binding protein [Pseudarthrobacter oxydans]|jgi:ABC-type Fe3+ transport system substrate-binding protein|uniref:ABC transporter substrate-binding protein n=1 Tax=Pseudarthrobacter oxydans TaxID=1671 RepID=UPI002AA6D855|nr:extracellular solute-binding protein [Pseudarthrobacter oxydans]WPU09490.1 extracellular solute-binding protein [Pseudarthrobacter oxydans]
MMLYRPIFDTKTKDRPKMFFSSLRRTGAAPRLAAAAGVIGLMTLSLTGCGGAAPENSVTAGPPAIVDNAAWDKIVESANKEGTVNLYRSLGGSENVMAEFEKAYPNIKIEQTFAGTGDLIQRLDQEIDADVTGADLVLHASPGWFDEKFAANKFASLSVSPDTASAGWEERLEGKSYATFFGFPYTLSSRTGLPTYTDLKSLLDANPNARVGVNDPHASVAAAFYYETQRQEFGDKVLDQLAATQRTMESGNTKLAQALAAGTYDYAVPGQNSTTAPLIAKGAQIVETVPTKGTTGAYYTLAVMQKSAHPNAATVLANWLMSRDGATSLVKHISPATVPQEIDGAIPWGTVKTYDPKEWTTAKWDEWIAKYWTPRFGG